MEPLNKFIKWALPLLAICGVALFFYARHRPKSVSPVETQKQLVNAPKTKKTKIWREALAPKADKTAAQPLAEPPPVPPPSEPDASSSNSTDTSTMDASSNGPDLSTFDAATLCLSDWTLVSGLELSQFEHMVRHGQYSLSATCREAMLREEEFASVKWFLQTCSQSADIAPENTERCVAQSFEFRSIGIAKVYLGSDSDSFAYSDLETSVLANILTRNTLDIRSASNEQLEQSIKIADEMIQRDPELYGAYKIKLVSLLMKEAKYLDPSDQLDQGEYEELISQMSSFEEPDPTMQLREESLDLELSARIEQLRPRQEEIASQVESVTQAIFALQEEVKDDPEALASLNTDEQYLELTSQLEKLTAEGEELAGVISETQDRLDSGSLSGEEAQDPDLVMLPFIRIMVQKDYEGLAEEAQNYIDEYPDSPYGYYFLAKALWQTGQQSEALFALKSAYVNDSTYEILLKNFQNPANNDPIAYLGNMRLMLGAQ